jgi:hypothetical protein
MKIMRKILVITLILFTQLLFGQTKYHLTKIPVEKIAEIEKSNNGVIKDTVKFRFKGIQTKTFIYKRLDDDFSPQLHVWYHIDTTKNDLIGITYNWDFYNPGFNPDKNEKLIYETSKREAEYQSKYRELNKFLRKKCKSSTRVNKISDNNYSFNEMTYWENKKALIYSRIVFQRTIRKDPIIGLAPNHFAVQMVVKYK